MNMVMNWLRSLVFKVHSPSKEWPDIEKIKTQAYIEGYEQGRKDERLEIIYTTVTPNMIRKVCGLEPIKEETK